MNTDGNKEELKHELQKTLNIINANTDGIAIKQNIFLVLAFISVSLIPFCNDLSMTSMIAKNYFLLIVVIFSLWFSLVYKKTEKKNLNTVKIAIEYTLRGFQ
jgi:hypothetical protein